MLLSLVAFSLACDPSAAQVERPNLGTCLNSCAEGSVSATDRATCRLNCNTAFEAPPALPPPALAPVAHCIGACASRTDAACVDACRNGDTPPAVIDALAVCVDDCRAVASASDDDRATCRLLCAQEAAAPPR